MRRTVLNWSGGKDCALSLYRLQAGQEYEVAALLTTVAQAEERILTHGTRVELLHRQAKALDIPLHIVRVPKDAPQSQYQRLHDEALEDLKKRGIGSVAYGDIRLQDVRDYREKQLARIGMRGVFPLWLDDSHGSMRDLLDLGFKAQVVCVDTARLPESFLGREVDDGFLSDLPEGVDPAGEDGEYHTFVHDGPLLSRPIPSVRGPVFHYDRFAFLDMEVPADEAEAR
jgi:uncharacterized protein (TIGR00290 family)